MSFRVGIGFDLHRLEPGNGFLTIGGVSIPHDRSLVGHSDGDVLLHAVTDALLGACGLGGIGQIFPDTDTSLKGASSVQFLRKAGEMVRSKGYKIGNIDSNVLAERPKLFPYFSQMQAKIAATLELSEDQVSVKAKTMERVGIIGAERAIAAEAVALVLR